MIIYLAMAIDIPAWGWKAIDKFQRGFFWRGSVDAKRRTLPSGMEQGL
jgi:hypothetical protein